MKQTAVEWLISELKKYDSAGLKDQSNYVIEMPTHILTELEEQAKELEKEQQGYSEKEALNLLTHFAVEIQRQNKKGQYPIEIKGWFERNKEQFKNK